MVYNSPKRLKLLDDLNNIYVVVLLLTEYFDFIFFLKKNNFVSIDNIYLFTIILFIFPLNLILNFVNYIYNRYIVKINYFSATLCQYHF